MDDLIVNYHGAPNKDLHKCDGRIAILIPCLNEEVTVGKVVRDFRRELPHAEIYVFDNGSLDRTSEEAQAAGAIVKPELRRGKGYVIQSMFRNVDADIYILVDGDDTYPAEDVHRLLAPILTDEADMVLGSRLQRGNRSQFHLLNRLGNWLFVLILDSFFKANLTDILSGYRAFNRRFVKNVPLFSRGFEIETELTIKAVQRGYRIVEVPVDLKKRPEGSASKIRLARDGILILATIMTLFRDYKPLTFFGISGLLLFLAALISLIISLMYTLTVGQSLLIPSVILAFVLVLASLLTVSIGIILHTIDRRFQEFEFQVQSMFERFSNPQNE